MTKYLKMGREERARDGTRQQTQHVQVNFLRVFNKVPQTTGNVRATEQELKAGPGRETWREARVWKEAHRAPLKRKTTLGGVMGGTGKQLFFYLLPFVFCPIIIQCFLFENIKTVNGSSYSDFQQMALPRCFLWIFILCTVFIPRTVKIKLLPFS